MGIRMTNIATPMPQLRAKFTNKLGLPLSGGRVYTYEPGTDIPKKTWRDVDKSVENTNPIQLDAAGEADIYGVGFYRVVVKDLFGLTIYDVEKTGIAAELDASFVVDASGKNQQVINNNTAYFYHTVLAMIADVKLTDGKVVATKGYHNIFDEGGAIYLISSTATDYSIPLSNGLHAVFRDTFDIRKFGIISSPTVRQDENLIRMRNYADSREYVIDFLGFDIVTPDSNAGISGRESVANGLWFEHAHHYKNLNIYNDKSERLETGKCCLIFCPTKNPDQLTTVIFENINLDPWNDNYQPVTENYLGAYDGMRHGIFCHPKTGSNSLPKSNDKYRCLNFVFKFININFISQAYSYNITMAALRSRAVYVDGLYGDAFLGINLDCYDYYAKNTNCVIRSDRLEAGRQMVLTCHHFEPELSGQGEFYRGMISLDNCHTSRLRADQTTISGQTLWVGDIAVTHTDVVDISNSTGSFEFQLVPARSGGSYKEVRFSNCKERNGIMMTVNFNNQVVADKVLLNNVDFSKESPLSGYNAIANNGAEIKHIEWVNSDFPIGRVNLTEYPLTPLPTSIIRKMVFRECRAPILDSIGFIIRPYNCEIEVIGGSYPGGSFIYRGTDLTSITMSGGVKFAGNIHNSARYSDSSKSTAISITDVIVGGNFSLESSGTTVINGATFTGAGKVNILQPTGTSGGWSVGTGINTDYVSGVFGESYVKNLAINQTVPANSVVKVTTTVNKYCKDAVFNLTSADIIKSVSISGTTATISLFNPTAAPIVVDETVSLKMII